MLTPPVYFVSTAQGQPLRFQVYVWTPTSVWGDGPHLVPLSETYATAEAAGDAAQQLNDALGDGGDPWGELGQGLAEIARLAWAEARQLFRKIVSYLTK